MEKKKITKEDKLVTEKKKLSPKGRFILTIGIAVVALLFIPSLLAGKKNVAEDIENPIFSVRVAEAQKQTLNAYLTVNGDIVSTRQTEVFPDMPGRLVSVSVSLGSYVYQGQVIALVDPSRPGAYFLNSPVIAPITGIVSRTPLSTGSTVGPSSSITSISANGGNMEINARIPEREIAGLEPGLKAEVTVQAYPGETFVATVNRVSPIIDSASRTKLINLRFDEIDHRINPGMFARIRINTRSYPDVLAVPAEAVVNVHDGDAVFVIDTDADGQMIAARREVQCGVTLQGWAEIKSGLARGESVIIQGQQLLSGGESVRVISSSSAND